jgi:hypothetical protein
MTALRLVLNNDEICIVQLVEKALLSHKKQGAIETIKTEGCAERAGKSTILQTTE